MVVQRGKILRRRQGRQMAFSLHGAEALQMMLTRRHGYYLAVPIKPDNRCRCSRVIAATQGATPHNSLRNCQSSGKKVRSSAVFRNLTPLEPPVPGLKPMMRSTVFMWRKRHCWNWSSRSTSSSASS